MKIRFFNPGIEFKLHKKEYVNAWIKVREKGNLILREELEQFEKAFAKFVGVKYAIGVSNGTDAIMMAVRYLKPEIVKVPYHTFKATVSAVKQGKSAYVFEGKADVTIVAHIAGELSEIPEGVVIEDVAQALGAVKNPKTFAQTWSFYPAKILGGYGDGGAITTNDKKFYEWAKEYRNHFKGTNEGWGGNHRLDNVLAAELLIKLKRIKKTLARRKEIAKMYIKGLKSVEVANFDSLNWQDFIVIVPAGRRDDLYEYLKSKGVETMVNSYPMPIKKSPDSLRYEAETLRLPINEVLTDKEVQYVIKCINAFYS